MWASEYEHLQCFHLLQPLQIVAKGRDFTRTGLTG